MSLPSSKQRLKAIEELISNGEYSDQQALVQALEEKFAIKANQAVVSRDLHRLGATKTKVGDKLIYRLQTLDAKIEILKSGITDIQYNESMVIIHTVGGLADFIGDYLDEGSDLEILATLAGENVVFIAPKTVKNIKAVYSQICTYLYFEEE